jgi:hypothetical protein
MRLIGEGQRSPSELEALWRAHAAAVKRGKPSYVDPLDGNFVMTAPTLEARGYCCGAGCRHCPFPPAVQAGAGRPLDAECLGRAPA